MSREIVLLLQENMSWESFSKYIGKDLFPLDIAADQVAGSRAHNDKTSNSKMYLDRHIGMVIKGNSRTRIVYDEGIMVVGEQEIAVRELVLTRMSGKQTECLKLAIRIAKKYACILENRSHEQRAEDAMSGSEFGRFHVKEFATRTLEDALHELIWWHLCGISQASVEFNMRADERLPVRRLRVEVRKLRAVLAMVSNNFNPDILKWREKLRGLTVKLSRLRELDVALSAWRSTSLNRRKYQRSSDRFSDFLLKERVVEMAKIMPTFTLNKLTPFLLSFMLWIMADQVKENRQDLLLDKIAHKKLGRWYRYMQKLARNNPEFENDELAHELRIKAKSMRYVMQSMSGKAYGDDNKVMRSLKRLLDGLGVLHDNCVNEQIARGTIKKDVNPNVIYQAGIFTGNERASALRVKKRLPELWEDFTADWLKWY